MNAHINLNITGSVFDFSARKKCEETMHRTFEEFRRDLANKRFAYDDIDAALEKTFLHVFNDIFEVNGLHSYFDKNISDFSSCTFVRGTILHSEHNVGYDRFEPKCEYMKEDNRFSPAGVEWLYIAMGETTDVAKFGSIKECRANSGDDFASVQYRWSRRASSLKLVDLTIAKDTTIDEINRELEVAGELAVQGAVNATLATGQMHHTPDWMKRKLHEWSVYTYAKMMSEQLFVPVDGVDKKLKYAPFQCLAKYFERLGYGGIVYDSTVNPESRNIVLFDKHNMEPFGDITEEIEGIPNFV